MRALLGQVWHMLPSKRDGTIWVYVLIKARGGTRRRRILGRKCLRGHFRDSGGTFRGTLCVAGSGRHGRVKTSEILHHLFILVWFISMYRLGMLTEIVEARKLLGAVASKRTLASMLSGEENSQSIDLDRGKALSAQTDAEWSPLTTDRGTQNCC